MSKIKELMKQYYEIISYLIVGGLTTVVSLGIYYGCVLTFLDPDIGWQLQCANVLSWIGAVTFAYFTNRIFVFRSKSKDWKREITVFYSSRLLTLFLDMVIMFLLVTVAHGNDKIAKLIGQVVVTIVNYLLSKLIVFKGK